MAFPSDLSAIQLTAVRGPAQFGRSGVSCTSSHHSCVATCLGLGVTISDGLLTSLNSVDTPLSAEILGKIAEIGTAAGGILTVRTEGKVVEKGKAACNAAPQIKKIEDVTGKDACTSR